MEFWVIMIVFICIGGSCSLAGTWWSKKKKNNKKLERIIIIMVIFFYRIDKCYIVLYNVYNS